MLSMSFWLKALAAVLTTMLTEKVPFICMDTTATQESVAVDPSEYVTLIDGGE